MLDDEKQLIEAIQIIKELIHDLLKSESITEANQTSLRTLIQELRQLEMKIQQFRKKPN